MVQTTVPANAPALPDPRTVVCPLDIGALVDLLRSLDLLEPWRPVVDGLRQGFNVGASAPVDRTFIFPNHASSMLVRNCIAVHCSLP